VAAVSCVQRAASQLRNDDSDAQDTCAIYEADSSRFRPPLVPALVPAAGE